MTAYIQSLLFEPNNSNTNDIIDDIRGLMLTHDLKKKYRKNPSENAFVVIAKPIPPNANDLVKLPLEDNTNDDYIKPKQKDSLFWCLYIAKHGYNDYLQLEVNYGMKQIEYQQCISEYIKKNLVLLKNVNTRITKACAQEIISELLTDTKKTSFPVLYAYAIYYNMNLILLHPSKKYYIEILSDNIEEDVPVYLLQKGKYEDYSIIENPLSKEEYNNIKETKLKLDSYNRPLKAIGNYKVEELHSISEKVEIDMTVKYTKPELYRIITEKIKWY